MIRDDSAPLITSSSDTGVKRRRVWIVVSTVVALALVAVFVIPSVVFVSKHKASSGTPSPIPVEEELNLTAALAAGRPCLSNLNFNGCQNRIYQISCSDTSNPADIGYQATPKCTKITHGESKKVRFQIGKDENSATKCYQMTATVGECWGQHPRTSGVYDCMGRCGASCGGLPGGWSADCWKHDICSWYFSSTDGTDDVNCGLTYKHAKNDLFCSGNPTDCAVQP